MNKTTEECWEDIWQPILEVDGQIDIDQLKKEFAQYTKLLYNIPKVLEYATGGMCSNPCADVDVVKRHIDNYVNEVVKDFYGKCLSFNGEVADREIGDIFDTKPNHVHLYDNVIYLEE